MSITSTQFVSCLVVACLTVEAAAQQFQMPAGHFLPVEAVQGRPKRPKTIWCNEVGSILRAGPVITSPVLKKQMQFLESAQVAFRHVDADGKVGLLLCYTTAPDSLEVSKFLGWIDEAKVLQSVAAEKVYRNGSPTKIHRKGMAVIKKESVDLFGERGIFTLDQATAPNRPASGKSTQSSGNEEVESVLVFQAPRLMRNDDPPTFARPIALSTFYFVFGQTRGLQPDFVLVGTSQEFDGDRPDDVVTGWLPIVNHAEWNNRFGYEWNAATYGETRKEKGFVFGTESQAREFIDNTASIAGGRDPAGAVYEEFIDPDTSKSIDLPPNALRMPQVEDALTQVNGQFISKVGWLGSANRDPRAQADVLVQIEELKRQSRHLDVMFLIDHTQTMEEHFPDVAAAVNQILKNLREKYLNEDSKSDYARTMRVSISFYGDQNSEAKALIREFQPVAKTSQPVTLSAEQQATFASETKLSVEQMLAELPKHKSLGGGGIEEDLLIGLFYGVDKFPDNDGRKLLFVIGDMGDRNYYTPEFDRKAGKVAQMLAERGVPIRMIALQVKTKSSQSPNAAEVAALFEGQLKKVIQQANTIMQQRGGSNEETSLSKVIPIANRATLIEEINQSYAGLQRDIDRFQKALRTSDPSLLTGTERRRLESQGIELNKLRHPLFRIGYVAKHPRTAALRDSFQAPDVTQVRRRVLISYDDLEDLKNVVGKIVESLNPDGSGDRSLGELFQEIVSKSFGEQKPIGSVTDAFELNANIKLNSRILTTIYQDVDKASFTDRELMELKAAYNTLLDILDNKHHDWKVKQVTRVDPKSMRMIQKWDAVATHLPPLTVRRRFTQPGDPKGTAWYWLMENEIP